MFELVPPAKPVSEVLEKVLDRAFTPVEGQDFKVEQVRMHPVEFNELRKEAGDKMDIETNKPLIDQGILGYLFGAMIVVKKEFRRHHYEVLYDDLRLKNVVCLRKDETTREDCPDLECLVDAVHTM
jgi:hypothetical protein